MNLGSPALRGEALRWHGAVPADWAVRRFKQVAIVREGQVDPEDERYSGLPLFAPNHIESGTGRLLEVGSATDQGAESGKYLVDAGDVLYSKIRPGLRKAALAPTNGLCSADIYPIKPGPQMDARFLLYSLLGEGFYRYSVLESARVAMPKINRESLGECILLLPSLALQRAIADFLDRKTASIDSLIEKMENILGLLAEKRQALVTRAVTQGLDPNASMKDSGVEWLRAIPAHWQVCRSKRLFLQRKQRAALDDEQLTASQAYGVIPQREYTARTGQRVVQLTTNFELRKRVERDDFVISMRSFEGGLERAWAAGGIRSSYVVLRPSTAVDVGYYSYLFKCSSYISALQRTALFIRDGQDLTFENFVLVDLPLPHKEEQRRIASFLDAQISEMNKISDKATDLVGKLREYRQALITAAVTGQVDVSKEAA